MLRMPAGFGLRPRKRHDLTLVSFPAAAKPVRQWPAALRRSSHHSAAISATQPR